MSINSDIKTNPDGSIPSYFVVSNFRSDSEGYVSFRDLLSYARLKANNIFSGISNSFNSIVFTGMINNVSSTTFNYLRNVSSDIQQQFTGIYDYIIPQFLEISTDIENLETNKRDLTNNNFDDEIRINELVIKAYYNKMSNAYSSGTTSIYGFLTTQLVSNMDIFGGLNVSKGSVLGNVSSLTRVRRNLNVDNVIRVGYNDGSDIGSGLSNNSRLDVNGSISAKNSILLDGLNLKVYIDGLNQTLTNQINNLAESETIQDIQSSLTLINQTITQIQTLKADKTYVDAQIASVYSASSELLTTIQQIQTELLNDNNTEIAILNSLSQKLNISDFNSHVNTSDSSITNLTNSIATLNTFLNLIIKEDLAYKINTNLNVMNKIITNDLILNKVICNEIVVGKISTSSPTSVETIIYGYFIIDNISYPIDKLILLYSEFNITFGSFNIPIKVHLGKRLKLMVYDSNNRIIQQITNSNSYYVYNQNIDVGIPISRFVLKPLP